MTPTTDATRVVRAERAAKRFARPIGAASLVAVLLLAALAATRFVAAGDGAGAPSAHRPGPLSATQQISTLEAKAAAQPGNLQVHLDLGTAYTQQAIATGDPAFYELASKTLSAAAALDPANSNVAVVQGVLSLSLHDFTRALALGEQAHAAAPAGHEALAVLVDANVELGRYDTAAAVLQQLLDLRPGVAAYSRLSYLRELHGDLDGAIAAMIEAEAAAAANPAEQATVATFHGDLLLAAGRIDDADVAYERALTLSPGRFLAQLGHARVLVARGQIDQAIAWLTPVAATSPQPAVTVLLGEVQQLAHQADGAASSFELARVAYQLQASSGINVELESALFQADHGDPAMAVTQAKAAYQVRRTVFGADTVAWSLYKAGQPVAAVNYVNEALALGTVSAQIRVHAAIVLDAAGDATRARAALQSAFRLSPWTVPMLRPEAVALGDRLDVPVPAEWRNAP